MLDQSMLLISLASHLSDNAIRRAFAGHLPSRQRRQRISDYANPMFEPAAKK